MKIINIFLFFLILPFIGMQTTIAIAKDPGDTPASSGLFNSQDSYKKALSWYQNKEFEKAITKLGKIIRGDPANYDAILLAGKTAYELKEFYLAETYFFEASLINPRDPKVYKLISDTAGVLNNINKSRIYLKKAIALDPTVLDSYIAVEFPRSERGSNMKNMIQELRVVSPTHWDAIFTANAKFIDVRAFRLLQKVIKNKEIKIRTSRLLLKEIKDTEKIQNLDQQHFLKNVSGRMRRYINSTARSRPGIEPEYKNFDVKRLKEFIKTKAKEKIIESTENLAKHWTYENKIKHKALQDIMAFTNRISRNTKPEQIFRFFLEEGQKYVKQDNIDTALELYYFESKLRNFNSYENPMFEPGGLHFPTIEEINAINNSLFGGSGKVDPIMEFQLSLSKYNSFGFVDPPESLVAKLHSIEDDPRFKNICILENFKASVRKIIGEAKFKENKLEAAARYLNEALKEYNKADEIYMKRLTEGIPFDKCPKDPTRQLLEVDVLESPIGRVYKLLRSIYATLGRSDLEKKLWKEMENKDMTLTTPTITRVHKYRINKFHKLGNIFYRKGSMDRAIKYMNFAVTSADSFNTLSPSPSVRSQELVQLARFYEVVGAYRQAKVALVRALAYDKLTNTRETKRKFVFEYYRLGNISELLQKPFKALKFYTEAKDIFDNNRIQGGITWEWDLFYRLGVIHAWQGNYDPAHKFFRKAINLVESVKGNIKTDQNLIGLGGNTNAVYEQMVELVINKMGREKEAFEWIEKGKSNALTRLLQNRGLTGGDQANIRNVGKLQEILKDAGLSLIEYYSTFKATYVLFIDSKNYLIEPLLTPDDKNVTQKDLRKIIVGDNNKGDGMPFLSMISYERTEIKNIKERSKELFELIIPERISSKIKSGDKIVVVPHGVLHLIPFGVLFGPEGFLSQHHEITYSPSANIFVASLLRSQALSHSPDKVLAVLNPTADPDFIEYATNQEIELNRLYKNDGLKIEKHISASELINKLPNYNIIHLYTHGLFDTKKPLDSFLNLTQSILAAKDIYTKVNSEDEYKLEAKLIIMAFCESGIGKINIGDEVLGLPRAFIYGGASTILASLWSGEAEFTEHLVLGLLKILKNNPMMSKARALKKAISNAIKVDEQFEHPFFWAPFVLIGSP